MSLILFANKRWWGKWRCHFLTKVHCIFYRPTTEHVTEHYVDHDYVLIRLGIEMLGIVMLINLMKNSAIDKGKYITLLGNCGITVSHS